MHNLELISEGLSYSDRPLIFFIDLPKKYHNLQIFIVKVWNSKPDRMGSIVKSISARLLATYVALKLGKKFIAQRRSHYGALMRYRENFPRDGLVLNTATAASSVREKIFSTSKFNKSQPYDQANDMYAISPADFIVATQRRVEG